MSKNIRIQNNVCVIISNNDTNTISNGLANHLTKHNLNPKIIHTTNSVIYQQDKAYDKKLF